MGANGDLVCQAIDNVYEGILDPQAWHRALGLLGAIANSEHAALTTWDRRTNHATVYESVGLPAQCCRDFVAHYCHVDPAREWLDRIAVGAWYVDHRHVGMAAMQRSAFYQDFLRSYELGSVSVMPLLKAQGVDSFLVIQHGLRASYDGEIDPVGIIPVVAHLQRAVGLRRQFEHLAMQADLAATVLGQLRSPLLVSDCAGAIVLANRAAETLMQRMPVLTTHGGRIGLNGAQAPELRRLLGAACGFHGHRTAGGLQLFNFRRELLLQIVVTPLPEQCWARAAAAQPLALVLLHDPAHPVAAREGLLRQVYGLSPSEARVALALLSGASPQDAATQLGVSLATVRTQLRAVFRKTGTARQTELVRMLAVVLMSAE